ncbi:MAG: LytTR family transcriptional regulator DNA-binding domain-containing protein [Spirochaetia bacterium]|nr:LytTR family transcriptional regulator DNA-binding domain-containing protein [Spirochaetia bacterium]
MTNSVKLKQTAKIILKWLIINTIAAFVVLILNIPGLKNLSSEEILSASLLFFYRFHIIAFFCIYTAHKVSLFYQDRAYPVIAAILLPVNLIAASLGILVVFIIETPFYESISMEFYVMRIIQTAPFTFIITIVMTLIFSRISYLEYHSKLTENIKKISKEDPADSGKKSPQNESESLSIKEQENYFVIPHNEILYLSAHNKITVIHSLKRDFRTSRLLKEIDEKLPEQKFMRIHKSFTVNLSQISHIQYFMGGSYLAFLKDEDETNLPVGKKYAPLLKSRLEL